jgi:hypothetical protein
MTIQEVAEELMTIADEDKREAALDVLPEPFRSHVREVMACAAARDRWARGEA